MQCNGAKLQTHIVYLIHCDTSGTKRAKGRDHWTPRCGANLQRENAHDGLYNIYLYRLTDL